VQHFGSFDYVIAGAGSAGCLLANRLSRDPDTRVLLLEAGGRDDWFWIDVPVGYLYTIANPRTDWCYGPSPTPISPAARSITRAAGYWRLVLDQRHDLHARPAGGLGPLGRARQPRLVVGRRVPVFRSLEDYLPRAPRGYGAGGEVRIEDPRVRWDIIDGLARSGRRVRAIPPVKMFNGGDNFGCAYFQ